MKKLMAILFIASIAIAAESCTDVLNETPNGRLTIDKAFAKSSSTISYLNSVYGYMPQYGNRYYFYTMLAGITDNGYDSDDTQGFFATQWYQGQLSPTNNPVNGPGGWNHYIYNNWWQGIRKANVFLAHIDDAILDQQHESKRARYKAEARLLRDYYYLELIKEVGPMPVRKKPFPSDFDYSKLERPSFDKVVQFIIDDCDSAIANPGLPWRITNGSRGGRFTKAVAYAIKSEATLFNASPLWNPNEDQSKWKQAAQVSKEALNMIRNHGYELYPDYGEYYLSGVSYTDNPSDKQTILQVHGGLDQFTFVNQMPIQGLKQFKAGVTPSQELVDSYDMQSTGQSPITGYKDKDHLKPIVNASSGYDPDHPYQDRDPRFYATVWYNQAKFPNIKGKTNYELQIYKGGAQQINSNGRTHTKTGYYLRKYIDPEVRTTSGGQSTWKRFQLAEIYLNYAEAENEANGPTQGVYQAIKTIRARVNMPPYPQGLTKSEMRKRIHNERRVELAFEGKRFWDQRRWKILGKTGKVVTGMQWTKNADGSFSNKRIITAHKHAYEPKFRIFPIPSNEISKLGKDFEQSPGW